METILEEVKLYDDATLREKLRTNGIPVGPITAGTKSLFQKRLANRLFELKTGSKHQDSDPTPKQANDGHSSTERKPSDGDFKQSDVFYAVCLPENTEPDVCQEVSQLVFSDKDLALKTAKKVKGSRFKVFKSESEAEQFSKLTSESAFQSPKKLPKEAVKVSTESSPYKGPKPQEIVILRRAVEKGDVATFKEVVWKNPRYLVSSGDTPVMFQEGPRYTAMHVAALKNQPAMCRAILDTLEDPVFVERLYSNSSNTAETQNNRINWLVDLYLNMPDKGNCESPLHMACKFGHDAVVEVLAAHPKTDRTLLNKWGDSPKHLICSRMSNAPATLKKKIEDLLKGQYYVPLIRSDDNSTPPVVGQPWSPDVSNSPLDMPKVSWSPKDPNISIKACAGPMSPDDANKFHKRWTTPPSKSAKEYFNTKRGDSEKGFERIGRKLAHEMQLPWKEYWGFLQEFADISTPEGLDALEEYFSKRKWITFIREFKDKYGILEPSSSFDDVSTPVATRSMERELDNSPPPVFDLDKKMNEVEVKKDIISEKCDEPVKGVMDNVIVSPVTGLSQSFAQMKLDDSWSEHATIDTSQSSEGKLNEVSKTVDKHETKSDNNNAKQDNSKDNNEEQKQPTDNQAQAGLENKETVSFEKVAENIVTDKGATENVATEKNSTAEDCDTEKSATVEVCASQCDATNKETKHITNYDTEISATKEVNVSQKDATKSETKDITKDDTEKSATKEVNVSQSDATIRETKDTPKDDTEKSVTTEECDAKNRETKDITKGSGDRGRAEDEINAIQKRLPIKRLVSEGSESVSSYETAADEVQDSSLSYVSESSYTADLPVCIYLKDRTVFNKIQKFLCDKDKEMGIEFGSVSSLNNAIRLILRLVPISKDTGMTVDIVSITLRTKVPAYGMDTISEDDEIDSISAVRGMLLLERVEVSSCIGEMGRVGEGEEVELRVEGGATDEDTPSVIHAYLTRSSKLPKCGYIHGPQPTREDLDVCRALTDCLITPDSHPNVFTWKLAMAKFVKDTNFKWQSPAKLKSSLRQGSPQASRGPSPVISYGSPLGLSSRPVVNRDTTGGSDIRTRLFSSLLE